MAAIVAKMEMDTQGLLTMEQVRQDLQQLLGKFLISLELDTRAGQTDYPAIFANLLIEIELYEHTAIQAIFTKLHQLYDHVDGLIRISCGEYSGIAGQKSLQQDTGAPLFLD